MTPMTYEEWCSSQDQYNLSVICESHDRAIQRQRYEAYLAAMSFIRTQIGGRPHAAITSAVAHTA